MIGGLIRELAKGAGELVIAPLTATNAIKDGLEREGKKLFDADEDPEPCYPRSRSASSADS